MKNYAHNLVVKYARYNEMRENEEQLVLTKAAKKRVDDLLAKEEKKRVQNLGKSLEQTSKYMNKMIDQGYELDIDEKLRWHDSNRGKNNILKKLNSANINTLISSVNNLRIPSLPKEIKLDIAKLQRRSNREYLQKLST